MAAKFANEDDLKSIEERVRETIEETAEKAKNDPLPDESELYTDVYR